MNAPSPAPAIDATTLKTRLSATSAPMIIDVRSAAEFESVHIRGAYNVPLPLLAGHPHELADRLRLRDDVVLVCQSGRRAEQARGRLAEAGVDDVQVLTGGMVAFQAAGGDTVLGRQRWDMERQVRLGAGSLILLGMVGSRLISPKALLLPLVMGTGLTYSGLTNWCGMAVLLSRMPWNRTQVAPSVDTAIKSIPTALQDL